jgi:hypothetical protein
VTYQQPTTTIAILGADTMVGRVLCLLLEGSGYDTIPLDSYPTGIVDELLDGADLLLLTPRLDEGVREAFLGAMGKSTPQKANIPVITLTTAVQERPQDAGVQSVPWPCETKVLVGRIEAALLDAPTVSTAPITQPWREGESLGSRHEPVRSPAKPMRLVGGTGSPEEPRLPPGYVLDSSDPEVLVLLCPQGEVVARFSARGATAEAIEREAMADYKERNQPA